MALTNQKQFQLEFEKIDFKGRQNSMIWAVFKKNMGFSELSEKITTSLSFGYRELRDKLIGNGDLKLVENKFIFQKNILFNSPSAAAAIIVGYSMNGPQNWKNKIGRSLKDIETQRLNHNS